MGNTIEDLTGFNIGGHSGADEAIRSQSRSVSQANNLQQNMYNQSRVDLSPYQSAGQNALGQLQNRLPDLTRNFTMQDYQADPGYQFRMNQAMGAINSSAAARGSLNSGGTLKALTRYGQDVASQEYQNAYNRFSNNQSQNFNRLSSLAGMGQNAANGLVQNNQNYANQVSGNLIGLGNAQAAGQLAQAGQRSGFINGALQGVASLLG